MVSVAVEESCPISIFLQTLIFRVEVRSTEQLTTVFHFKFSNLVLIIENFELGKMISRPS